MKTRYVSSFLILTFLLCVPVMGRTKLTALPERAETIINLDNPQATLISEERILTLQKGVNKVDFSWKGVRIDTDSIRLRILGNSEGVRVLSVSYPPDEQALVWNIYCEQDLAQPVRISYLLSNIDRLIQYRALADKNEETLELNSFVVVRNFSGEDFEDARMVLDYGRSFSQSISDRETKRTLLMRKDSLPITKVWSWDSQKQAWDPEKLENENVGIPVSYEIPNTEDAGLGREALYPGKVRVYQQDGKGSKILLGEDVTGSVETGENMELYIGDSRDIVVTQQQQRDVKINIRRDDHGNIVLYDTDQVITAKIENFRDKPARLTLTEHIPGQWEMESCNMDYELKDANTLEFRVQLEARDGDSPAVKNLEMHYHRRNVRAGNGFRGYRR